MVYRTQLTGPDAEIRNEPSEQKEATRTARSPIAIENIPFAYPRQASKMEVLQSTGIVYLG